MMLIVLRCEQGIDEGLTEYGRLVNQTVIANPAVKHTAGFFVFTQCKKLTFFIFNIQTQVEGK